MSRNFYCTRKSPVDECFFRFEIGSKSIKHGSAIVRLTFGVAPISRFSEDSKTRILKLPDQFHLNLTIKTALLSKLVSNTSV